MLAGLLGVSCYGSANFDSTAHALWYAQVGFKHEAVKGVLLDVLKYEQLSDKARSQRT